MGLNYYEVYLDALLKVQLACQFGTILPQKKFYATPIKPTRGQFRGRLLIFSARCISVLGIRYQVEYCILIRSTILHVESTLWIVSWFFMVFMHDTKCMAIENT